MIIKDTLLLGFRSLNPIKLSRCFQTTSNLNTNTASQNRSINIFDRDAKKLQKERAALRLILQHFSIESRCYSILFLAQQ